MSQLHQQILYAWANRDRTKPDAENIIRISNEFSISEKHIRRILGF